MHDQCSNACAYCAALCKCTSLDCAHHHRHEDTTAEHDDQAAADTSLHIRLAMAVRNTPGFVTDSAAPWDIADSVINELKTVVKD